MERELLGTHHITAIAGEPQDNLDFYAGILGLRLVKLTINFDDPETWPKAPKGRKGTGQLTAVSFAVPKDAIEHWVGRLDEHTVAHGGVSERFGEQVLSLSDPDGVALELIATAGIRAERAYDGGPVRPEYAIHGFHSATLTEAGYQGTAALLTDTMGFRLVRQEGNRFRYAVEVGEAGAMVDLLCSPEERPGRVVVGTVHHIAWRTGDDQQQEGWRKELARLDYDVTPMIDRKYFHSIYYREPGGILFEIATDPPGFAIDEAPEALGSRLQLPPWLESARQRVLAVLPPLRLPAAARMARK